MAAASLALAGCGQPADISNDDGAEPSETADNTISGDAAQTPNTMGIGTMQEPEAVVVPLLDPIAPPRTDESRNEPRQLDDVLEQPGNTVRDAPQ